MKKAIAIAPAAAGAVFIEELIPQVFFFAKMTLDEHTFIGI